MRFRSPTDKFFITSRYGYRDNPYPDQTGQQWHNGIDLRARYGEPIYSIADGVVKSVYWHDKGGNSIIIDHKNGYRSGYAHLSLTGVEAGQVVRAGEQIGESGNTGGFDGMASHLHLTVRKDGEYVNPETLNWSSDKLGFIPLLVLLGAGVIAYMNTK